MPNAKIRSIQELARSLFLIKLEVEGGLKFKAGQFVIVKLPPDPAAAEGAKPPKGFYSLASAEQDEELEFLVERKEGYVSQWMTSRKPGELLDLDGPMGKFALAEPMAKTQIFLGFKAGLAPLRSMILTLAKQRPEQHLHLYLGAKGSAELLFDAQWRALEKDWDHFHYHPVLQPTADNPFVGKNQDPADELIKKMAHKGGQDIYLAGFKVEIEPMKAKLEAAGFDKVLIKSENFG